MTEPIEPIYPDAKRLLNLPLKWWVHWGTFFVFCIILCSVILSFFIMIPDSIQGKAIYLEKCTDHLSDRACTKWILEMSAFDQMRVKQGQAIQVYRSKSDRLEGEILDIHKLEHHFDMIVTIHLDSRSREINQDTMNFLLLIDRKPLISKFF